MYRKRILSVIISAVLLGSYAAPTSASVLIDFDNLPGGGVVANFTPITNQYAVWGVTFSVLDNGVVVQGGPLATTQYAPSGQQGNRLGNFFNNSVSDRADVLRMQFDAPVSNVSFDFFPQGDLGDDTRVQAYDSSDNLIFDQTTGIEGFLIQNYAIPVNGISRIDMTAPTDGWNWGLDNLMFDGNTAVPEPATLAMWAVCGALSLGYCARFRVSKS